jgi:hypothetical protein
MFFLPELLFLTFVINKNAPADGVLPRTTTGGKTSTDRQSASGKIPKRAQFWHYHATTFKPTRIVWIYSACSQRRSNRASDPTFLKKKYLARLLQIL